MVFEDIDACGTDPSRGTRRAANTPVPASGIAARSCLALVVTDGEPLGRRVAIGTAPVVIGRGAGVDLQIVDPTVSRHHCVIWRADGRCWIRDLASRNCTRVNARAESIAELGEGDVVVIGQTALTVIREADRPSSSANAAPEASPAATAR